MTYVSAVLIEAAKPGPSASNLPPGTQVSRKKGFYEKMKVMIFFSVIE